MRVHSSRLIPAFDQSHQEALLGRVSTTDDDTELRVVKDVLQWELNLQPVRLDLYDRIRSLYDRGL